MSSPPIRPDASVDQARQVTDAVLNDLRACKLNAQHSGDWASLPKDSQWAPLSQRLIDAWTAAGYGPGHPLPQELATYRTPTGATVMDTLLDVASAPVGWKWMEPLLDWALATGWSVWTPGLEGDSGLFQLLSIFAESSALCDKLGQHGVDWNARVGAAPPTLVIESSSEILPAVSGESLLTQAVMKAQGPLAEPMWPLVKFLVARTQDAWAPLPPSGQTILDFCDVVYLRRLASMRAEEDATARAEEGLKQTPSAPGRSRYRA